MLGFKIMIKRVFILNKPILISLLELQLLRRHHSPALLIVIRIIVLPHRLLKMGFRSGGQSQKGILLEMKGINFCKLLFFTVATDFIGE